MAGTPKPSEKLHHFYTGLGETLAFFRRSISPKIKQAHNLSGGFVRLADEGATFDANSQLFTRLSQKPISHGDRVLVGYLESGEAVVLGRLHISGEDDAPLLGLRIESQTNPVTTLQPTKALDFGQGFSLIAEDAVGLDAHTDEVNIELDTAYLNTLYLNQASGDSRYLTRAINPYTWSGHLQGGRYASLLNTHPIGTLSGITLTANRLYFVPVWVAKTINFDAIMFNITTTVSGQIAVGIYETGSSFLPGAALVRSGLITYNTTGVKTHGITSTEVEGGRWWFLGLCAKTAQALSGSSVAGQFPALRGGAAGSYGESSIIMAQQDLTAGWTELPATASAGSGASNSYLHITGRTV